MNKKSDRFNKKIKYERKMNLASKSFLKTSESNSVNVVEKKAVNSLKSIADSTVTQQEDELDHFGKYIIAMLRQLPPLNALICQQEIQNILTRERIAVMERTQNSLSPVRINDRSPSPSTSHFSTDVSELTSPGSTFQGGIVKDEEIIM